MSNKLESLGNAIMDKRTLIAIIKIPSAGGVLLRGNMAGEVSEEGVWGLYVAVQGTVEGVKTKNKRKGEGKWEREGISQ